MKILIVEDDRRMAGYIRQGLVEEGYAVDLAYSAEEGQPLAEGTSYDLIILDVILPGRSGVELCRDLRDKRIGSQILILTCKDDLSDKVKGLDAGADDYLTKPFEFPELFARVRALLRRVVGIHSPLLRVADVTLDTATKQVKRDEIAVQLTRTEYAILRYLMSYPGSVVSKSMIEGHVWNTSSEVGSNRVEVHMARLRAKLGDKGEGGLIRTVRGFGYVVGAGGD